MRERAHWQQTTLGAVVTATGGVLQTGPFGSQLHASDYAATGTPVIMPVNIGDNKINPLGIARVDEGHVRRLRRHALREGDIVFGRRGDVGRRSAVTAREAGWLCGTGCLAARFGADLSAVNPVFVSIYIGTLPVQQWLADNAVGGTLPNLNTRILSATPIQIPSCAVQDRLVDVLKAADGPIAALGSLIVKKEAIKQGLMQELLSGRTRLPGFEGEGTERPVGDVTRWLSGGTPHRGTPEYWNGTVPWISATTLKTTLVRDSPERLTLAGLRAGSRLAPKGASLVLVRGMALHRETRIGLAIRPVSFNQDVKALVPHATLVPEFLLYALQARGQKILDLVSSAGSGTGVIDTRLLRRLPIWVPNGDEQRAVARVISDADDELATLRARLAKANAVKQGMMQELLTGHTRLPIPQPAEATNSDDTEMEAA